MNNGADAVPEPAPPAAPGVRVARAWRLFVTAVVVLGLDLVTKLWVLHAIPENSYNPPWKPVIDGFLYLVHIGNKGAAFGTFSGYSWLLAILAVVALLAIYAFRRDLELHRPGLQIVFGLIIGGILGNFIDRVWHGHVIDFIDVHFPFSVPFIGRRFPAFNVADSGITVGVSCYFVYSFIIQPRRVARERKAAASPPDSPGNPGR